MRILKPVLYSTLLLLLQTFSSLIFAQRYFRDPSFNNNWYTTNACTRVVEVLPNDKIVVAGNFLFYDKNFNIADPGGIAVHQIIRLKSNGKIDKAFNGPELSGNKNIYTIAHQSDDKILIGGDFVINATKPGGLSVVYTNVARLLPDGDLDFTFNPSGGGTNGTVRKILVKDASTDGARTILIGGIYTSYNAGSILVNGRKKGGLIEVNENGSLVRNWQVMDDNCCTSGGIWDMAFTKDNKVVIGGEFGMVGTQVVRRLARLNRADGSLDPSFFIDRYGPSASIYTVAIQADNKIVYGGGSDDGSGAPTLTAFWGGGITPGDYWTQYPRRRIGRLNADGRLDPTFNPDGNYLTGAKDSVFKILIAADGKILLGGRFSFYQGKPVGNIVRLSNAGIAGVPDGQYDGTFDVGAGFNSGVYDIDFQEGVSGPEHHILGAGDFMKFDTYSSDPLAQGYVMRLIGTVILPGVITDFKAIRQGADKVLLRWRGLLSSSTYELQRSTDGRSFTRLASFTATKAPEEYNYTDAIKGSDKYLYYRVAITDAAGDIAYSSVIRIKNDAVYLADVWVQGGNLKVSVSSATPRREKLSLQIVSTSGQQLLYKPLDINGTTMEAILPLQYSIKNCIIVLQDQEGTILFKTMWQ